MDVLVPAAGTPGASACVPRISETYWGYVIHEDVDRFERETLSRAALRFMGLVLVLSAYGQWLLPGALYSGDAMIAKTVLSLALGLFGAVVYWAASRESRTDVQVDLTRRELRVSEAQSRGRTRTTAIVPMGNIASAFIVRPPGEGGKSQLYLRLKDRADPMHVATGSAYDLKVLHRRLAHDLRPLKERIDHRLARTLPFQSSRIRG